MEFSKEKCSGHHKGIGSLIKVLILFLFILTISTAVGGYNKIKESRYIGQDVMIRNTFTVSDSAEVYAKPDLALVNLSVRTESKAVAQAMLENTDKMNAVINSIKSAGVEEKDLKTTTFNIYPQYSYPRSGARVLTGYEVTQSLEVKIRQLDKIGDIIQRATEKGANQANNLTFLIDNEDELKEQARAEAIKKAKAKGKKIAEELGVSIVGVVNFNEGSQAPVFSGLSERSIGIGGGGGGSPDIATGENKIEVNVNITYEIN